MIFPIHPLSILGLVFCLGKEEAWDSSEQLDVDEKELPYVDYTVIWFFYYSCEAVS